MCRLQKLLIRAAVKAIAFRAEIWLWLILEAIHMLILLMIWQGIYADATQLNGVQFNILICYYIIVFFVEMATAAHFENWRINEIREGKIDFYLVKPLGYLTEILTRHIGDKIMSVILKLPLFFVFIWIVFLLFHPALPATSVITFLHTTLLLTGAFCMQFCLSAIIVMLGFWLENAEGLDHFRWLSTSLFSGIVIPFAFMPSGLLKLAQLLPFKYLHSVPVLVLLGQQSVTISDYIYLSATCLVLIGLTIWFWKKARARYSAYGG